VSRRVLRRAAATVLALGLSASPAAAYLAEVTTSVAVSDAGDQRALQDALMTAVDGVLKDAIAFTPTLIVLTSAAIVGDRLYVRLLVADAEGERTFDELNAPPRAAESVDFHF
jgi:hypothetical protein